MKPDKRKNPVLEYDVESLSRLHKSMVLDNVGVLQYISFGPWVGQNSIAPHIQILQEIDLQLQAHMISI